MVANTYYATIGRSKTEGVTKTKIRLKPGKHKITLAIAQDPKFFDGHYKDKKTIHIMSNEDWSKISGEIKVGAGVGFTTIFKGSKEIFTLCNRETKRDIENAQQKMMG